VKPEDRRTGEPGSGLIEALKTLQSGVQQTGPAAAAAYSLTGAILFLGGLGYLFDRWQGTAPTGLVVGMLLGVVIGMYLLAKELWHR
jgi:F0F1-type ATP synthase assembly protein I